MYNKIIVDRHRQVYESSCIPSSIEIILKLNNCIQENDYFLQLQYKNRTDLSFQDFDNKDYCGLMFYRKYSDDRNDIFPINELFATIESEIMRGKYLIVSLPSNNNYHMWIIHDIWKNEYLAFSKGSNGCDTIEINNVKSIIKKMKGTDVLIYEKRQ